MRETMATKELLRKRREPQEENPGPGEGLLQALKTSLTIGKTAALQTQTSKRRDLPHLQKSPKNEKGRPLSL